MQPEDLERIAAGLLNEVPANFSTADLRDLIVELLFGLGVSPSDLPMFCLLLIVTAVTVVTCSCCALPSGTREAEAVAAGVAWTYVCSGVACGEL